MIPATDYEKQAAGFLAATGVRMIITYLDMACPSWTKPCAHHNHGDHYRVEFRRAGRVLSFGFWNSYYDSRKRIPPTQYGVLACISSDADCPETFEEFCADYGYDTDSRRAEATFRRCSQFARRLRAFFTAGELEQLSEIR